MIVVRCVSFVLLSGLLAASPVAAEGPLGSRAINTDPRGSLGREIAAGSLTLVAVVGLPVGFAYAASHNNPDVMPGAVAVMAGLGGIASLGLVPWAVHAAGNATGGSGSLALTFLASLGSAVVGMVVVGFIGLPETWMAAPAVLGVGIVNVGSSVLVYRLSCNVPVAASIAPTADADGALLTLRARL